MYDGDAGSPANNDEGFWPSLDPRAAGYIGKKSRRTLERRMTRAKAVLEAWMRDEWRYVGVVLSVSKNGVMLDDHAAAIWGVEMNYPSGRKHPNAYLDMVARDLLPEAISVGKEILKKLKG